MAKTPDEIRTEAAAAARADMDVLGHPVPCMCGCLVLFGQQYRWHYERIACESLVPVGTWLASAATAPRPRGGSGALLPTPEHVHTPSQGSGIPYCTTCGAALPSFEPTFVVGSGG